MLDKVISSGLEYYKHLFNGFHSCSQKDLRNPYNFCFKIKTFFLKKFIEAFSL